MDKTSGVLFRDLAEFAPDGLLLIDSQGVIKYANTYAHALFGYEIGTLVGCAVEQLIPHHARGSHVEHRQGYAANAQMREMGSRDKPLWGLRQDGSEFRAEIRIAPIRTNDGVVTAAAVRDATEKETLIALLNDARVEAEKANEIKSQYIAAASHDLRQPLQTLRMINASLSRQTTDPMFATLISQEKAALDTMTNLLSALLNISKLGSGTMTPVIVDVAMDSLITELHQQFDALAKAKGLELDIESCNDCIRTDRALFYDLMLNLVSNAIRYTETGNVHVRFVHTFDERLTIEVADTGIGIAAEKISKIWDDFYQISEDGGSKRVGTGLGLAIVRRIADMLQVPINVSSTLGVGTTFSVDVLRIQASINMPLNVETNVKHRIGNATTHKIILVEDDDGVRSATTIYLDLDGYSVHGVASLHELNDLLEVFDGSPSLVISDFHLQRNERGSDAIKIIRDKYGSTIPAIVLTGDTSVVPESLCTDINTRMLNKPIDVISLTNTINELLGN